jgi:hypothetical protein
MCASTRDFPTPEATPAAAAAQVSLIAEAADPATEVVLINHELRKVDSAVGRLEGRFEPGFYKLKFAAGGQSEEQLVELSLEKGPVHITARPIQLQFSVPLAADGDPAGQVEAAVEQSRQVHRQLGSGSQLFLFARDLKLGEDGKPWRGVSLSSTSGHSLVDLERDGVLSSDSACGAVTVSLDPGVYCLTVDTRVFGVQQMPVVASPGWQTQVFLASRTFERSVPGGEAERSAQRADLFSASVLMGRAGPEQGFVAEGPSARLVELARRALEQRRDIVRTGEFRDMLLGKFQDPMLGLLAGNILLVAEKPDLGLLGTIVANLRGLGITDHPDLRALELALGPSQDRFDLPPMLRASWHRIVAASAERTDLIPRGSLSFRIAPRVIGNAAWLVWRRPGPAEAKREERDIAHQARRGGEEVSLERGLSWLAGKLDERSEAERSAAVSFTQEQSQRGEQRLDFLERNLMAVLENAPRGSTSAPSVEELVHSLDLPAANVEDLLGRVLRKKGFH